MLEYMKTLMMSDNSLYLRDLCVMLDNVKY